MYRSQMNIDRMHACIIHLHLFAAADDKNSLSSFGAFWGSAEVGRFLVFEGNRTLLQVVRRPRKP